MLQACLYFRRGIEVMADTLSQFVPVYQYIFSFEVGHSEFRES